MLESFLKFTRLRQPQSQKTELLLDEILMLIKLMKSIEILTVIINSNSLAVSYITPLEGDIGDYVIK